MSGIPTNVSELQSQVKSKWADLTKKASKRWMFACGLVFTSFVFGAWGTFTLFDFLFLLMTAGIMWFLVQKKDKKDKKEKDD